VEEHDVDVKFETGSRNMLFRACAIKIMQYNDEWLKCPHPVAFLLTTNCDL